MMEIKGRLAALAAMAVSSQASMACVMVGGSDFSKSGPSDVGWLMGPLAGVGTASPMELITVVGSLLCGVVAIKVFLVARGRTLMDREGSGDPIPCMPTKVSEQEVIRSL